MTFLRLALVCVVLASASAVYAQPGLPGPYLGAYYGVPWLDFRFYSQAPVPHFALYPPVYYSVPVARTYGYSPFAYPPGVMTPEICLPEVKVVPSRGGSTKPASKQPGVAVAPLRLVNPYVAQTDESAPDELVQLAGPQSPRPLVLFPSAFAKQARR